MKFLTVLFFISLSVSASICSKDLAIKKVNEACHYLQINGKETLKKSYDFLLFENCGKNYIWIQDTSDEIKMVFHPIKQRMNGTVIGKRVDEKEFPLFIEFDKVAKNDSNGGWVNYVWPKLGEEKATPKTSFVKLCELKDKTKWVLGSGIWNSDLK